MKKKQNCIYASLLKATALSTLALAPAAAFAQSYGSLVGTVADASGGAIPNATVTLTNVDTGAKRVEQTGGEGEYRILNLIPGNYREDVEVAGFKHFTRGPIKIDVETSVRVDVPLTVGAVSEIVEVTSETPLLQTESATLQQVVTEKTVAEMPLNGRNVMNLIALTPGVVAQGATAGAPGSNQSAGHTNSQGWNNYQIGGGIAGQAAQFLDGAPLNGLGGNQVFLIPNQDGISEFRVGSSAVSPEFGRYGGGVVNFTSKSGGNSFHGSAYEYFRNKALNAATYFGKRAGQPKAAFDQNQFGGTIGGRVIKDKAFFFGNYEQYKIVSGTTFTATVPTVAERTGDFSADNVNIYDPYTTNTATGLRTQFAGNKIPTSRFDYTANQISNVVKYYPLPNITGQTYNYVSTQSPGALSKQGGVRFDYNVSDKQHFFARYTQWNLHDIPLNGYENLTGGAGSDQLTKQVVLGDTYTFTSRLTGDLRVSYSRAFYDDNPPSLGTDFSVYGPAWSSIGSQVSTRVIITPGITGYSAFNGAGIFDTYQRNEYAVAPTGTYLFAKHIVKFGADVRLQDLQYVGVANPFTFAFTSGFTSSNAGGSTTTPATGGQAFASFLLGAASSGTIQTAAAVGQYNYYQGYFVTDTWQASRNLTVNVGVRYELPSGWAERKDKATVLLPNAASSLGTVGGYALKGGLFLVNSANYSNRTTEVPKHNLFAPRIGVSYNPIKDTVVRAGYGIAYLPMDSYNGGAPYNSPINTATTTMVTSVNNANQIPLNTLSNPFPAGGTVGNTTQSILQPVGRSQAYLNNLAGLNISGPVPQVRFPYSQQWTASLQQQFIGDMLLQIAYEGNRGTFLPEGINSTNGAVNNLNQLADSNLALGSGLTAAAANPFAGTLNSTGSLNSPTVNAGQLLRPFPEYSNVVQTNAKGDSIYHSLQLSVQKRFKGGGLISSNYTWAKNIGNVSGTALSNLDGGNGSIGALQDFTNPRGERSILNADIRNRFVTAFVTPLPFGKDHRFFSGVSGVTGGFVNGWEANGIMTLQSGNPLSIVGQANTLSTSFGFGTIRPNYVPSATGCNGAKAIGGSAQSRITKWFNTACFVQPGAYALGNEPRVDGTLRGAGIANYDLSLSKTTGLKENLKLQMKVETFNLFNRVQFNIPNETLGGSTFGQVSSTANQPRQIQLSARLLF